MSRDIIVLNENLSACEECGAAVPDSKMDLHIQYHGKDRAPHANKCPICSEAWVYTGRQHTIDSGTCARYRCASGHILLVPSAAEGQL